jgi:uncharacterized glyoxalase superfamily protein PhnB
MSKSSGRPADCPWLSPYLTVRDPDAALDFYSRAFGFSKKIAMPGPSGQTDHAEMTHREALIMFGREGAHGGICRAPATSQVPSPVTMYVYCDDVDSLYARATAAGATSNLAPENMFWGDRMCKVTDPDGHVWNFATHLGTPAAPNAS